MKTMTNTIAMFSARVVIALALLSPFTSAGAQAQAAPHLVQALNNKIVAARNNSPMRIDGRLDERVWYAIRPSNHFVQRDPLMGAAATLATDVRMLLSDDAVIFGVRLHDDFASVVRPRASDSVSASFVDDYFEIQIDPHPEHVSAFVFTVSPSGGRSASVIGQDGTRDTSWDLKWDAATRVDEKGWTLEVRIPLAEFHIKPGSEQWGVQFIRFSQRKGETDVFTFGTP